jgi:hypothetical protein
LPDTLDELVAELQAISMQMNGRSWTPLDEGALDFEDKLVRYENDSEDSWDPAVRPVFKAYIVLLRTRLDARKAATSAPANASADANASASPAAPADDLQARWDAHNASIPPVPADQRYYRPS